MIASSFRDALHQHGLTLQRSPLTTLQINVGKLCNQTCRHCHVDAGPNKKRENMDQGVVERLEELVARSPTLKTIDLTGGAPELNPSFRRLVSSFRDRGLEVIDRCNLTVLFTPGQDDTALFLARKGVHVVASLPCYSMERVDTQRGDGVFRQSIEALRILGDLGYGKCGSGLELDLVYNPTGASLPPPQRTLERDYKQHLAEEYGISFNRLLVITNMPIKRFLADLRRTDQYEAYMNLLRTSFNPEAARGVMCRSMISVGWDGKLFDCDFNQMLALPIADHRPAKTIWDIHSFDDLAHEPIAVRDHCFGCTAGSGSSCGGSLLSH